ncbi:helix-turn-helix domain-containing protein [Micromonospora sp. LOL_023]|uniref:helix-turn-helix domain-containing protein n=1 Tax=Micromonospora sp. LOL_023 TaxID=3345418 RepID=UPI003A8C33DD
MLSAFGLSETAGRVYLNLVGAAPGTVTDLADALTVEPADVAAAVTELTQAGLVRVADGLVDAAPPELAIDALLMQRVRQLQEARISLGEWLRQRAAGPADQGVAMVVGAAAITQTFDQFLRGARDEVLGFDRPPYASDYYDNPTELDLLCRGVKFRVVYDRRVLERPHAVDQIGRFVAAGEQARIAAGVPGKLAVADRRRALLSFPGRDETAEPWALMVQGATWVDVLVALFSEVWDRATPLRLAPAAVDAVDRWTVPTAVDRRILSLLMSGLPDKAVANQLGMSLRTVQRRLRQLMDVTGSATRMQLGWYAARNDWL